MPDLCPRCLARHHEAVNLVKLQDPGRAPNPDPDPTSEDSEPTLLVPGIAAARELRDDRRRIARILEARKRLSSARR